MGETREIRPVDMQMVMDYLRANLRIEVKTDSVYSGGMDGGPMYEKSQTVQLVLDGEVISEAYL